MSIIRYIRNKYTRKTLAQENKRKNVIIAKDKYCTYSEYRYIYIGCILHIFIKSR